jgi:HEAT repeat protein
MLEHDPDETVQLSAAEALGRFVLLGELEEIPSRIAKSVNECLFLVFSNHPAKKIQQEILKSLSFANLPEITKMITSRIDDPDQSWQLAALIAMGRSADERWEKSILRMLKNPNLPHQIEAVRSAGELELHTARPILLEMLENTIRDEDLRYQVIWSLAKIGGEEVRETLEKLLEDAESDDEAEIIEMALEHLAFNDELPSLDIYY